MGHTVGGGILIRVTVRVRVRTTLMDTGRARFRGQSEDSALGCKTVGVVGVVVLRAGVSTMAFERVSFRLIGSDRYLYAKSKPNSLGCSSSGCSCSRGGGRCVHDYSSAGS